MVTSIVGFCVFLFHQRKIFHVFLLLQSILYLYSFQIIVGAWLNFAGAGIKYISAFPEIMSPTMQLVVAFIGELCSHHIYHTIHLVLH